MESTLKALNNWLSSFGWPVYGAGDVPHGAELPYITANVIEPEWDQKAPLQVQLWAYTKQNLALVRKADAIVASVGTGRRLYQDDAIIVVYPDTPLQQVIPEGDVRRVLILLQINAYHMPGV